MRLIKSPIALLILIMILFVSASPKNTGNHTPNKLGLAKAKKHIQERTEEKVLIEFVGDGKVVMNNKDILYKSSSGMENHVLSTDNKIVFIPAKNPAPSHTFQIEKLSEGKVIITGVDNRKEDKTIFVELKHQ